MAAIRHLGFVTSSYRTTREVLWLHHMGRSNFILIQFSVLKIWRFEFFCRFGLKCLFTPQNFGFWGSEPQNVIGHHRDPQKAHSWPQPHLHAIFCTDRSTGATCAREKKSKKERKNRQGKKLTVANWVFAQTIYIDAVIRGLAQRRRAIEALEACPPPDSIVTVVNSLQNRVNSITLCITLNAKTEKIVLVTLYIQIEWLFCNVL